MQEAPGARGSPACTSGEQRRLEVSAQELKGQVPALQGIEGVVDGSPSPPSFCILTLLSPIRPFSKKFQRTMGKTRHLQLLVPVVMTLTALEVPRSGPRGGL